MISSWKRLFCFAAFFSAYTSANPASFYANPDKIAANPAAYALSEQNQTWLKQAHEKRALDATKLIALLKNDANLYRQLKDWTHLTFEQRMALLPKVFELECQSMGITPPTLVINNKLYPQRAVNFVFDVRYPGSGLVYLNPNKLKEMDVYAPLAFLLHETRHAYQYQLAFSSNELLAQGYLSAFETQTHLSGASFSDFLTLLNEYEAFQFANQVLEILTDGQFDSVMMGTFASQFDAHGELKIDLIKLHQNGQAGSLLEKFNEHMTAQYKLRD